MQIKLAGGLLALMIAVAVAATSQDAGTDRRGAAQRALPDRRRSEHRPRRLRRSGALAEHRSPGGARRAVRSRVLAVSAVQSEPLVLAHRPAAQRDRRAHQSQRRQEPDVAALPRAAAGCRDAPAALPHERLVRRARRQALSLRRAERHRHVEPRRLSLVGSRDQSARARSRDPRPHLFADARPVRRRRELARGRWAGRGTYRRHRRARGRAAARALQEARTAVLSGRRLLSAAHAVRRAEGVLRSLSATGDRACRRCPTPIARARPRRPTRARARIRTR